MLEELFKIVVGELLKVILGISTVTLSIYTLYQRHKFNEYRKSVSIAQGVFRKSSLTLGMFGVYDVSTYILAVPLNKSSWEIPFVLNIDNEGDKAAEELEILYRTNKEFLYAGGANLEFKNPGIKNAKVLETQESGPFITIISSMENLHPKQGIKANLISSVRSATIFPLDIAATSSDGIDMIAETWINMSFPVDLVISQKDDKPCSRRFNIQIIDTSEISAKSFFDKYNEALRGSAKATSSDEGLWTKIRGLSAAPAKPEKVLLVYFDEETKVKKTIRSKGHKLAVYEVPVEALYGLIGFKYPGKYVFPYFTAKAQNNRLTNQSIRPPTSAAD